MFGLRPQEIILILLILVLLFGAKKLPDLARGVGRSLRILKAETREMNKDDDEDVIDVEPEPRPARQVDAPQQESQHPEQPEEQPKPDQVSDGGNQARRDA